LLNESKNGIEIKLSNLINKNQGIVKQAPFPLMVVSKPTIEASKPSFKVK